MIVYLNGSLEELNSASITPFDRGFLFADGVYEVIRTYGGKFFLFDEHIERLKRNTYEIRVDFGDFGLFSMIADELVKKNGLSGSEVSLYIQITRGGKFPRTHAFPAEKTTPSVFCYVSETKPGKRFDTASIITAEDIRWKRCDIKSINLLPSILANQSAKENGHTESIWIQNGNLLEGTHTNVFAVKKGKVITPPLSNSILPGITRGFVLDLCRKNNIKYSEENIPLNGIENYDELFITGTMTEIKPVIKVNDIVMGKGSAGEVTLTLIELFKERVLL